MVDESTTAEKRKERKRMSTIDLHTLFLVIWLSGYLIIISCLKSAICEP